MLDRLLDLEQGVSARAERRVTGFPGGFPRILLVECVAQLAGIIAGHDQGEGGFLAALDRTEFLGDVREGDTLTVSARMIKSFGRLCLLEGEVRAGAVPLLKTALTIGIGRL
jgi:3-hydroxyacyl-[acyl-carrier-protein] dehydratase